MDETALAKLSAEQIAALSDEHKAVFCMLVPADQDFFAGHFTPADLPTALARKGEILKRSKSERERMEKLKAFFAQSVEAHPPENDNAEGTLTAAAMGVLGVGGAVAAVTDNTARYRGVSPADLVAPLRAEFGGGRTRIDFSGPPEALTGTVALVGSGGAVPAMTVILSAVEGGVEVKVNDLTTRGLIESLKEGGKAILDAAGKGLDLLKVGKRGGSPEDLISTAQETLSGGAGLAEAAGGLKLKERAWKAIRAAAESLEAAASSRLEEERKAQAALEAAWDRYTACPTCGVSFAPEDTLCRVCGTARPEKPLKPDPRAQ